MVSLKYVSTVFSIKLLPFSRHYPQYSLFINDLVLINFFGADHCTLSLIINYIHEITYVYLYPSLFGYQSKKYLTIVAAASATCDTADDSWGAGADKTPDMSTMATIMYFILSMIH